MRSLLAAGFVALGLCVGLTLIPSAAEPPKNLNEMAAAVAELKADEAVTKPESDAPIAAEALTAHARVKRVLGLLKYAEAKDIDDKTLQETLDAFGILGQLRPDDLPELKSRFFLAAMRKWVYENRLQVENAKAKAMLDQSFDLGQDAPE